MKLNFIQWDSSTAYFIENKFSLRYNMFIAPYKMALRILIIFAVKVKI